MNAQVPTLLPLYSLVIVTYNQERFIAQTIRAALAQTYPNLEVVISDDASTDRTWEIIQAETQKYSGKHKIALNRNEHNLGIGGGASKGMELARGEVIVWNDGDDISLPNRVQKTYEAFLQKGEDTLLIWCNNEPIDADGKVLGKFTRFESDTRKIPHTLDDIKTITDMKRRILGPYGTVTAFRRNVLDTFGFSPSTLCGWDIALEFRVLLLGKMDYIPDVLVQYRSHPGSTSNSQRTTTDTIEKYRNRMMGDMRLIQFFSQHLVDINYLCIVNPDKMRRFVRIQYLISRTIKRQSVSSEIMSAFPHLSFKLFLKALPYLGFHRHFLRAIFYKVGLYR